MSPKLPPAPRPKTAIERRQRGDARLHFSRVAMRDHPGNRLDRDLGVGVDEHQNPTERVSPTMVPRPGRPPRAEPHRTDRPLSRVVFEQSPRTVIALIVDDNDLCGARFSSNLTVEMLDRPQGRVQSPTQPPLFVAGGNDDRNVRSEEIASSRYKSRLMFSLCHS